MVSKGYARPRKWTEQETARLLSARQRGKTYAQCALMLGRRPDQVRNKLRKMGATSGNSLKGKRLYEILWSDRELTVLKRHYGALGPSAIAERLGRTARSVSTKAIKIGAASQKLKWPYADVVALLVQREPMRHPTLLSQRSARAIVLLKCRLRKLHHAKRLDAYIRRRPGAPRHCVKFGSLFPPGLKLASVRLTSKGKANRAREYLDQEAERERQKAAFKKWQARRER